ncbi:phage tail tape measure protein [Gordonia sp. (in: high G+C Gram-positive bacteria)]|uniref:phage tail tape measure protein n=1 Tax=Gordonia sp. (in: high G+C Gram-positive bacteria) TaxID=84139 RepID=UPI002580C2D0|nr:phage tail tape measure protein [Gordonia sp. (in: high G+C Gram-positive bacteria)]
MALNVGGLKATLELDTRQYKRDLEQAREEFTKTGKAAESAAKQTEAAYRDSGRDTARHVDRTQADITDAFRKAETNARSSATGITDAFRKAGSDSGDSFKSSLSGMVSAAGDSGGQAGLGVIDGFAPRIASLGSKAGPIGAALAGTAALGLAAGTLLADQVQKGFELQQQRGRTSAQFGWTDQQMEQAGAAAADAYTGTFGDSVNENMRAAGLAMQSGLLDGNATAAQIQPVIEKLQTVSGLMETDVTETARAAGQMVKTGLADTATEALDQLTVAQQKGLNVSGDLLDTMTEYGTQFRKVGLDGTDALGLINQAWQNGARDTDIAADAIKEFTIRATDGSEQTAGALEGLGLNVGEITDQLAQGGDGARAGLDTILDKLREMPASVEKNQIAAALFGGQWEDLGEAFDHFDLSNARDQLGQVGGAADDAADRMVNGATSVEGLKRTVEVASSEMQVALAEGFGPVVASIADGIMTHKDDIIAFFADSAAAALDFGIGMGNTAAAVLHIWGTTTGGIADMVGSMVESIGSGMALIGGMISHIPGLGGIGDDLEEAGHKARGMGDAIAGMGESAHGAANFIADELVPGMASARDSISATGDEARDTAAGMDILTASVIGIPDEKTILINDNSPETKARLDELGFKVETLPDGTVRVTADTEQGERTMDEFVNRPRSAKVVVYAVDENGNSVTMNSQFGQGLGVLKRAGGGPINGPGGPRDDMVPLWGSAGEFMQQAAAVDHYGLGFMHAVNDRRFPKGLAKGYAGGGPIGYGLPAGSGGGADFPDWIDAMGAQYGVTPSTYAGHQESNRNEAGYAPNPQGLNRGIDWSGSVGQMQAFAEAMMAAAPGDPSIEQVIWMNPQTGQKLGWHGRSPDTDGSYYAADYGAHTDHVHTRFSAQVGAQTPVSGVPGVSTVPLTQNPDGTWTSPDPAWAALIARESGGDPDIVQGIQDANSGGNEASGLFQIARGTWSGYGGTEFAATTGQATPEQQAEVAARIFNAEGGSPWGSGLPGREDEAGLRAGLTTTSAAGSGTDLAATTAGVQPVMVTNWPSGLTTTVPASRAPEADTTPVATPVEPREPDASVTSTYFPGQALNVYGGASKDELAKQFPNMHRFGIGGTIPGVGDGDIVPMLGTPGEEVITKKAAQRWRPLLKAINSGALPGYANGGTVGGFAGYTDSDTDVMAPNNLYDWLGLGVGAGFAGLSVVEPYAQSAISGKWNLGNITPQINTGTNTSAIASDVINEVGGQLMEVLQVIAANTAEGKNVTVRVEQQSPGFNAPQLSAMANGVG